MADNGARAAIARRISMPIVSLAIFIIQMRILKSLSMITKLDFGIILILNIDMTDKSMWPDSHDYDHRRIICRRFLPCYSPLPPASWPSRRHALARVRLSARHGRLPATVISPRARFDFHLRCCGASLGFTDTARDAVFWGIDYMPVDGLLIPQQHFNSTGADAHRTHG